jgi:hypothetical protein
MWRKGVVLLALSISAGGAELAPLFVGGASAAACTDHSCLCHRRCPPKRTEASPCHESGDPSGAQMNAACHHGEDTAPAPARPQILPPAVALLAPWRFESVAIARAVAAGPGHLRRDLPPPRLFS